MTNPNHQKDLNVTNNPFSTIRNVSDVDFMDGHAFEYFCADILTRNGFNNVSVTKGSGDQGVDVLASKNEIRYAVQCKNYAKPLSNTPIQEVYAGKTYYNCHVGVVMTNSTFTSGAIELANSTGVLIWDRKELQKMIENANNVQPIKVVVKRKNQKSQYAASLKHTIKNSNSKSSKAESSNNTPKNRLRKNMKISAIVCFVLALLYIWTAIIVESFTIAFTVFFSILGIMFIILALSPKDNIFLFGRKDGLKKKYFVLIMVCLAFITLTIIQKSLQ
ncbi:MAG: restriction endonuclease [Ruminococcaceae bacterium]|nr:restriction endonuclease [Oscillospiraceae bacterium]